MAKGRLISRSLGSSRKFAELPGRLGSLGEFAQLLYVLIIPHTDDFGRMSGDAFSVKYAVLPTSKRDEDEFETALDAMDRACLIRRYPVEGNGLVLQIERFDDHQTGLHKRTSSRFHAPPERTEVPGNSRKFPEIPSEQNRTEQKGREEKGTEGAPAPVSSLTGTVWDEYRDAHNAHAGRKPIPLGARCADWLKLSQFAEQYPDGEERRAILAAFFNPSDKAITKSPYSIGWLLYWAPKLAERIASQANADAKVKEWLAS